MLRLRRKTNGGDMELEPVSGGDWLELDYREDSWHKVWLGWERKLNLVAVVMSYDEHRTVMFSDGGIAETKEEVVRAAIVPNKEAMEAFLHPFIYIERHEI